MIVEKESFRSEHLSEKGAMNVTPTTKCVGARNKEGASTQNMQNTLRQCAWCLRLIDKAGKRISVLPSPKLYKATHGMCRICALGWMEQVAEAHGVQAGSLWDEIPLSLLAQEQWHETAFADHMTQ